MKEKREENTLSAHRRGVFAAVLTPLNHYCKR